MAQVAKEKITAENFYRASFLRRTLYKLRLAFTEWMENLRIPFGKIIGVVIIALLFFSVYMIVKVNAIDIPVRAPYNKEGFVAAIDKYKAGTLGTKVYENDSYIFTFDETTTHFTVTNKANGQVWASYPSVVNSNGTVEADTKRDIVNIYFYKALGTPSSMGSYRYAVKEELINNENKGTDFFLRYNDEEKSIEVLYHISPKSISTTDLPTQMSKARFQEMIIDKLEAIGTKEALMMIEDIQSFYHFIPEKEAWVLKAEGPLALSRIDNILKLVGYGPEDLAYDNADQGIAVEDTRADFEVAVKYTLTEHGFEAKIINDSIVEKSNAPIIYIDFLPFFGSSTTTHTGYVVIPEGSGILINHNSGKNYAGKRLYGPDIANSKDTKSNDTLNISLPLFGVKQNEGGFISVIKNGAAMATMLAQNPSSSTPFNYSYFRFHYREGQLYEFVTWRTVQPVTIWTKYYSLEDYTVEYRFTDQKEIDYVDMANMYRDYLFEKGFTPKPQTSELLFNLTLLGGYEYLSTTLGIPTHKIGTLTSFDQARKIIDELTTDQVFAINVLYQGWMNDGIRHYSPVKIKNEKAVGTRSDLIAFGEYLYLKGIGFYPEMNFNTYYTDKNFSKKNDSVRTVFANVVESYRFNPATLKPDRTTTPYYTLRATEFDRVIDKILKTYAKQKQTNISLIDLGNALSGSYRNKDTIFRNQTQEASRVVLEKLLNEYIEAINLHNPSGYALEYVTNAVDVSMFGPQGKAVDATIPFYQLVVSGLFEYAGDAINMLDLYSYQTHVLKVIETGSNLHFTWSYENTLNTTKTEYNNYYSTYYQNWYEKAVNTYHEINSLGIHGARLIDHNFVNGNTKLVLVTYDNGTSIFINYSNNTVTYSGSDVPAMSYKVVN